MIRRWSVWLTTLVLCAVVLCIALLLTAAPATAVTPEAPGQEPETQELIVILAADPGAPSPKQVVNRARLRLELPGSLGTGSPQKVDFLLHRRAQGRLREQILADPDSPRAQLERTIVLRYPSVVKIDAIAAALERDPNVLSVERNRIYRLAVTPGDPLFPQTPSPYDHQWGSHLLRLPEAWDYTKGNAYVGIIDTGIDTDHEDLQALRFHNGSWIYLGGNFRPQFSYDYNYDDSNVDEGQPQFEDGALRTVAAAGHGTHVAGIVAATADNGLGGTGVCWHCSLMIAKTNVLAHMGGGQWGSVGALAEDAIVEALTDLTDKGAQLINMSFEAGFLDCESPNPDCYCKALAYAHGRDLVMVAASGNGGRASVSFPASHPDVVAAGGVIPGGAFWNTCDTDFDTRDCPSNYGSDQELVAPARQVLSTFYLGLPYAGTGCDDSVGAGGSGYGPCTGTSMASPYTTGSAALVRSVNPLLTEANVRHLLNSRASNNGTRDFVTGYGIPNVFASVQGALGQAGGTVLGNRLTPLFSLYSAYVEDHFYTTVPQMATAALLGWDVYSPTGPQVSGYGGYPGIQCENISPCFEPMPTASVFVFTTDRAPFAGTPTLVPLYRLSFEGANPNGNSNHRDTNYTTEAAGIVAFRGIGYELDGIEGYIYKQCTPEPSCMPAGTVRLLRRYDPQRDDFAIFPESELAAKEAQGYTSTGGSNVSGVLGYVYPNADADGDNLIDGFERLAGTNVTVTDSDCDGASDGAEALNYPYGDPLGSPGCVVPAPTNLLATASGGTVSITWTTAAGADGYDVERKVAGAGWAVVQIVTGPPASDTPVSASGVVLYRVVARAGTSRSAPSNHDVAYVGTFTDDPVLATAPHTMVKAANIIQLRRAVNGLREVIGLSPVYSGADLDEAMLRGQIVDDAHFTTLLNNLNAARTMAGLPSIAFHDPPAQGQLIRRTQIEDLRNGVK
jgi:subtilisin family serine protease